MNTFLYAIIASAAALLACGTAAPIYVRGSALTSPTDCDKCMYMTDLIMRSPVSTVECMDPICQKVYPLVFHPLYKNYTAEEICAELDYCIEPDTDIPVIAPGPIIYLNHQQGDNAWILDLFDVPDL